VTLAFVDWGYVVVGRQYRGAAGSEGKDEFGGADLNDVLNLFPFLDTLPMADPSRIGMAGFSRRALMTYPVLTKTNRIKGAMVAGGPVDMDFRIDAARRKELGLPAHDLEDFCLRQLLPNYERNRQKEIDARSPIKWAEKFNRKTLTLDDSRYQRLGRACQWPGWRWRPRCSSSSTASAC
jgi:predicted acyl esterase